MTPFAWVIAAVALSVGLFLGTAYGIYENEKRWRERLKWMNKRY